MTLMDRLSELNRELYSAHTGIGFGVIASSKQAVAPTVGGWVELARTTLGSAGDSIDVASLADKRYLMVLQNTFASGTIEEKTRLNADIGTTYAGRQSLNGGSDFTNVNRTFLEYSNGTSFPNNFSIHYLSNLSAKEKLAIMLWMASVTGAATAPVRGEAVGKWTNTSAAINEVDAINIQGGSFATGSEVVVLGWDPADVHTTNFWEELASVDLSGGAADVIDSGTFTAKKYLWIQTYMEQSGGLIGGVSTFNSDTGMNYARRRSSNGAADSIAGSEVGIDVRGGESKSRYDNMFVVNNSAQEKLVIGNLHIHVAGAGTAPERVEYVAKWTNTASQITKVTFTNADAGSYGTNTILKVWGSN